MPKQRLDVAVVARGLTASRELAQRLIMAGEVVVDGRVVDRPATAIAEGAEIVLKARPRFVSRGGDKLQAALDAFRLDVQGALCADIGASTGGFTDCLLQAGAARVYAVDVGHGILDQRLRNDPRVVVMEETNARYVEALPEPVSLVTIDASFISLKLLLPVARAWLARQTGGALPSETDVNRVRELPSVVALIKPQFEAGEREVSKGRGVIRDPEVHARVVQDVLAFAESSGWQVSGQIRSPLTGPKGNVEFLAWLTERRQDVS